ncbi:hypothetical protein GCM10023232_09250 [Sphingosinicella ginsenosidimutans]|jgi:hypothetical protein|uniref:Uncharacterized protein n=1 Tax=Allosphingosinicella ginsenosidimutans TaxID=1176539 RepID=A0A5C6TYC4_9SPHN|nr:hypothetical protein [Sphingosinicella ginsenosidimutans]TXC64728.1 hypothetical protein FRZ32_14380 [Sphingosinicella ginsenosidimutans]
MVARAMLLFAGLSLAVSPALAQPSAQPLSLANAPAARASARTHHGSDLAGGFAPAILALAIIAGGVLLAAGVFGDDDRDTGHPSSP